MPLNFEVVHKLTATQSGIAPIPLALTTPGSLLAGRAMLYWRHYHARADHRRRLRAGRAGALIWRPDLTAHLRDGNMGVVGAAIGLVYPVTAVSIVAAKVSVTVVLSQARPMLAPTWKPVQLQSAAVAGAGAGGAFR